jgi:hypothetical protein
MGGVKLALDPSRENILVETDCFRMVLLFRSTNVDRSYFGHLVEDLRELFSSERVLFTTKFLGCKVILVMSLVCWRIELFFG